MPDNTDYKAWFDKGVSLAKLHKNQEVIEAFKQAISINPNHAETYFHLAGCYEYIGRYQEAIEAFEQAIKIGLDGIYFNGYSCSAMAHYGIGACYLELRRYHDAAIEFEQVLRLAPSQSYGAFPYIDARNGLDIARSKIDNPNAPPTRYDLVQANSSGSGCFIATAVYGNYDAHEVLLLRRWRDGSLSNTHMGQLFIRLYYKISPSIATWIKHRTLIKMITRKIIDGFIHTWLRDYR